MKHHAYAKLITVLKVHGTDTYDLEKELLRMEHDLNIGDVYNKRKKIHEFILIFNRGPAILGQKMHSSAAVSDRLKPSPWIRAAPLVPVSEVA